MADLAAAIDSGDLTGRATFGRYPVDTPGPRAQVDPSVRAPRHTRRVLGRLPEIDHEAPVDRDLAQEARPALLSKKADPATVGRKEGLLAAFCSRDTRHLPGVQTPQCHLRAGVAVSGSRQDQRDVPPSTGITAPFV